MKCPGCSTEMTPMTLDARLGGQVAIDVCARCQAFWFDHFESLKLSPGSTLKLMKFIGEHSSPGKLKELRQNVQFVNCSNCGASINLESNSACPYCHSPLSMLDMKQPQRMLEQLKQAAEPKPLDPTLPLKVASAKMALETSLADYDRRPEWWSEASCFGLVGAGLTVLARWLSDKLVD